MSSAIIVLSHGNFGGAQKRFLNLFFYLNNQKSHYYYFLTTDSMHEQIKNIFPEKDLSNVIVVKKNHNSKTKVEIVTKSEKKSSKIIPILKKNLIYKTYYFFKLRNQQKECFEIIDKFVIDKKIKSILAVYTGVLPLYFYFKRDNRPKIIFSNMDSWFTHLSSNLKRDWYKKYDLFNYAHKKADQIDILSPFILNGLKERRIEFNTNKISITACSYIDYSKVQVSNKNKIKIVFSGRLEKDKNPLLYTEACLSLAPKYPNVEFHIIGSGRLLNHIKKVLLTQTFPNIILHGFLNDPNVILKHSSVFVSLQSTNNYPSQSVLEAMACGNAIIATDVGDTRLFINENNGTLIDLSLNSLVNAIEYYIKNPTIAENKGKLASIRVKNEFTIEKAANYYLKLFQTSTYTNYEDN